MDDIFSDLDPDLSNSTPGQPAPAEVNTPTQPSDPSADMFSDLDPDQQPSNQTSGVSAFLRGAERSFLPAAGGLAAAGAGAEAGAAGGAAIGSIFGGVGAAPGALIGGMVGGIGGAFAGSGVVSNLQDWALHALPESWQDALGQSDRQQKLDQAYQPTASFLGGLVPYALTLKPSFNLAARALPDNATAWQKIVANPLTAHLFGGATMGGLELGQEIAGGKSPNWTNVAISTGFGIVFNRPNRLGEALAGGPENAHPLDNRPEQATGAPAPVPVPRETIPTVAQAGDAKVMGPGITEDVFMGSHQQAPEAAMTAQDTARTETSLVGPAPQGPDVTSIARRLEPETFARYDELTAQRIDLASHLDSIAQEQVEGAEPAPDATAIQSHIAATNAELLDLTPQVQAAYRRAADVVGSETVAPETTPEPNGAPPPQEAVPATENLEQTAPPSAAGPITASVQEQATAIAADVTRQLIASGRPADEAAAAGQLLGERYRTRAARLGNAVSPQALYDTEGPIIRGRAAPVEADALAQSKRDRASGYINQVNGIRRLITLTRNADASSMIHESGHEWLDELMRDAVHPAATDALKTDAQTVRDWLGMDNDQIQTRQHEKFARGFEQYMREGVAPSAGLARVFSQFKTWLTQIYQTIKGLGSPINENIRGVFDRMLAEEPQRTVLAPERETEQSLAALHETEAAEALPHEAGPIGDRIAAERDAYIAQQPVEVQNELARATATAGTDNGPEGGAGAGGGPEVVAGGGEPEPQPEGGAGGGERGPLVAGSGTGVPQGAGVPAGPVSGTDAGLRNERSGAAVASRPQPLAPEPANLFGARESPFVDKAGNIRIDNLTTNQDVAQAIRDSAQENNDFIGDRRGVITDGQVLDLADALGMTPDNLNKRQLGQAFNAEQVVAARKLLIQSATDLAGLMKRVADGGTDEDVLAYAQAKARHQMIQGQVAGITAEAGRALRAFRDISGSAQAKGVDQFIREATGKTLFQLREEAKLGSQLDSAEQVSKFVRDGQKRTFGSMVLEYWINGLISGPATHTTYAIGNTILSLERMGPETAAAAAIGAIRRAMGREGPTVKLGEVGAQFRAAGAALPSAAKAAIEALRTGVTTRLPGEEPKSLPFQPGTEFAPSSVIDESMRYSDVAPYAFGLVQGIRDGLVSTGKLVSAGGVSGEPLIGLRYSPLGAIPDVTVRGINTLPVGTVLRVPSRFVAAIHSFFRTANYSMAKNALAYRSAAEAGLEGTAFDAHVANLRQNPTTDMMEAARGQSNQLTLMGKGSEFVQALSKLTNAKILGFPILKFVDPFVHIAGNVLDQSIVQRTPLGILAPEIRADLMGKNGTVAQDTAMAKMLVGTGIALGFGSLAAQGLLSGSEPSDPNQAAMWRLAGNQAHSIRIGDMWYDVHRLGPMGMLASMSADMYDVAHAASEGDMSIAGAALIHAFTQTILDESFMSGPSELIQALEHPGWYGAAYVRNQIGSFIPYSVAMSQMDRATDPYSRQAKTIIDAIRNKVPGMSESLMPRRDIWGEPIANLPAVGGRAVSAIYAQQISTDPVNQAMLSLGIYPKTIGRKIRGVALTDAQYDQFATLAGRMTKQRLDMIVNSPDWRTWDPTTQHDVISEVLTQSREAARGMMLLRFPQIAVEATRAKLAPLNVWGN